MKNHETLLLETALDNKEETMSLPMLVAHVALLVSVIFLWIRGTKQYIDHRLQEIEEGKQEA